MTAKSRIKLPTAPVLTSLSKVEASLGRIAAATAQRNELIAKLDAEVAAVRKSYETAISLEQEMIDTETRLLSAWAQANLDEFGKKRSLTFVHGVLGFRTGTPKVKTRAGFTFDRIRDCLLATSWGAAFVRTKQEVDKEAILGAFANGSLSEAEIREVGARVVQEESFFIEPAVTEPENRIAQAA